MQQLYKSTFKNFLGQAKIEFSRLGIYIFRKYAQPFCNRDKDL